MIDYRQEYKDLRAEVRRLLEEGHFTAARKLIKDNRVRLEIPLNNIQNIIDNVRLEICLDRTVPIKD